jgi:phosphoribosyl-ATP pyrophosphohydrolase/phosphoribosyl-AMP cyclohydrolase
MVSDIKWTGGLIPAVIQDYKTQEILMLAYMNEEALSKTLSTGETHFYSRSRRKLWRKGETSGNIQRVRRLSLDCDRDTLRVEVEQVGVACHTGRRSCFFQPLSMDHEAAPSEALERGGLDVLYATILSRKAHPSPESYTSQLFEGGLDRILKKVVEEAGEFIISAKNGQKEAIAHEAADLLYHLFVALADQGIALRDIETVLRARSSQSGLAEKRARPRTSSTKGG